MEEFWIRSQKSASVVEPGEPLGERWNARPRGIELMGRLNMVVVMSSELRFEGACDISL